MAEINENPSVSLGSDMGEIRNIEVGGDVSFRHVSRHTYSLLISFHSNEHPFSTEYEPYPKDKFGDDDAEAIDWAEGMRDGLGAEYSVTLLKDGVPFPSPQHQEDLFA